jgi:hypothetical protein
MSIDHAVCGMNSKARFKKRRREKQQQRVNGNSRDSIGTVDPSTAL